MAQNQPPIPGPPPPGYSWVWDGSSWKTQPITGNEPLPTGTNTQGNPNESFRSYEDAMALWTYQQKVAQFGTKMPAPPGWKPPPMPAGWGGSKPQGYGQPTPGAPPQPAPSPSSTVAPLGAPPVTSTSMPPAGPSQPGYSGQMQNMLRPTQTTNLQQPTTMQQAAPPQPEQPIQADPYGTLPWAPNASPSPYGLRTGGPGTGGDYERRTGALKSLINPSTMQSLGGQPPATPPAPTGGGLDWSKLSRAFGPAQNMASAGPTFGYSAFGGTAPKQETAPGYGRAQGAPGLDLATLLQQNNAANPVDLTRLRGAMADPYSTMLGGGGRGRGF